MYPEPFFTLSLGVHDIEDFITEGWCLMRDDADGQRRAALARVMADKFDVDDEREVASHGTRAFYKIFSDFEDFAFVGSVEECAGVDSPLRPVVVGLPESGQMGGLARELSARGYNVFLAEGGVRDDLHVEAVDVVLAYLSTVAAATCAAFPNSPLVIIEDASDRAAGVFRRALEAVAVARFGDASALAAYIDRVPRYEAVVR